MKKLFTKSQSEGSKELPKLPESPTLAQIEDALRAVIEYLNIKK